MSSLKIATEFAVKIAQTLDFKEGAIAEWFEVGEGKDGFFYAKLQPKKWLDDLPFRAMCALCRDFGGDYAKNEKCFRIPGPLAKKPLEHGIDSQPELKKVGNALPKESLGALPITIKPGFYQSFPVASILSPRFTLRLDIEADLEELKTQIVDTVASGEPCIILEPLVCRPASQLGYVEVGAGERRLLVARKLGLGVVPVVVKNFSDEEFDRARMMENLARKDLTDYETARVIKYLMDTYPQVYPAQINIADAFGKSREWVTHHLQMLEPKLSNIVSRDTLESGQITEHQAREILAAPEEKREEIIGKINETGKVPSVRELHEIAHPEARRVPCAHCGEQSPRPFAAPDKKFYCSLECYEHAKAEAEAALINEEPSDTQTGTGKTQEQREDASIEVAVFTCTECKQSLSILHLPSGRHKLQSTAETSRSGED
ncbi:ParB/RepB/Spo0J family partition protein [Candidatus Bathyarchaeota archaeon]|nr:ParB/RepB/Spo0J family partition protein [Candidatus Bathyarchaeota archaeon]